MRIDKVFRIGKGKVTLLCASLILALSLVDLSYNPAPTIVRVYPSETTVQVCSNFLIQINVVEVYDLFAFDFQLSFDAASMECINAEWGSFLFQPGAPQPPPAWNNEEGRVWGMISLMPPEPGRFGSGTLVVITFHCKNVGTSDLDFDYTHLFNSFMVEIPHGTQGGTCFQVKPPEIGVSPSNLTAWTCDNFTVNVTISNVVDLYSWEFNMTFDPTKMECLSVEEGPFLKKVGMTTFIPPTINNAAGTINGANCTTNFLPGVSGSGTLANVTFHCKGAGQSILSFSYTRLINSTSNEIRHGVGTGTVTQQQRKNITFRLLAVEHYFDSQPMKSAQHLIQQLKTFLNWQNKSWGEFNYTSYIHLLSYDSSAQSSPYYRGTPTNSNVVNEITNFLAVTSPGESNNLTIRIFYYNGHSGKLKYTIWPIPTPCQTYMCLGTSSSHPEGPTGYQELYGEQLDALLTSGELRDSNCTLVILDTCYSGGYLNSTTNYYGLNHPGRVVLTATDAQNEAVGWFDSPNVEDYWGWFTGHQNAKYNDNTVFGPLGIIGGLLNANDTDSDGWRSAGEVFEFANQTTRWYSTNQTNGHNSQWWMEKMYPQACYGVAGADIPLVMYTKWISVSSGYGHTATLTQTTFSYNGRPLIKRSFPSSSWRMFQLDARRTGTSEVSGPSSPTLLWNSQSYGSIVSSPAIADQMVFIGSNTTPGCVYAIDLATGNTVWSFTTAGKIYSSPAVMNGIVYIGILGGGGGGGRLYALEEYTGLLRWNFTTPSGAGGIFASPAIDQDMVFIATMGGGGGGGYVYALNATTGEKLWEFMAAGSIKSSPAVANNRVFVATMGGGAGGGGYVYALNELTGLPIWPAPFETNSPVMATPTVADGMVFIATMGGGGGGGAYVWALSESSGTPMWAPFEIAGSVTSSPAVDSSKALVIVCSNEGGVYGLNEMIGLPMWISTTGPVNMSSPAISNNGCVYVGSTDGYVYCLNETSGETVWIYGTGSPILSSPALTDDHTLIGSMDGKVYCFGPAFPVYNVAVLNVKASSHVVFRGDKVEITCIMQNKGTVPATFNLTIGYSNVSAWTPPSYLQPNVMHWQIISLDPGGCGVVTYQWDTTTIPYDNYTISATAAIVLGETDAADNTVVDTSVFVTVPGDITGLEGIPDGIVDIHDLYLIGKNYGNTTSNPGESEYYTTERVLLFGLGIPTAIFLLAFLGIRVKKEEDKKEKNSLQNKT